MVFDPLAVSLVLAFNVATKGKIVKEPSVVSTPQVVETQKETEQPVVTTEPVALEPITNLPTDIDVVENLKKEVKTFLGKVR